MSNTYVLKEMIVIFIPYSAKAAHCNHILGSHLLNTLGYSPYYRWRLIYPYSESTDGDSWKGGNGNSTGTDTETPSVLLKNPYLLFI